MKLPFVGPSYQMDALSFDIQRSINLYLMMSEIESSKEPTSLRSTPGLSLYTTAGTGPIRGGISSATGRSFVMSGAEFYEITAAGSVLRGSVATAITRVAMDENNNQEIIIVDNNAGYIFNQNTNAFTQISDVDFPIGQSVTFQDGYFIANEDGTQKYYISGINDGFTWSALDFGTAANDPDNISAVISSNSNLWLLGERSVEVHQNNGNVDFPFQIIPGAVIQTGCASPYTVQKFDNSIAWLGVDEYGRGIVWRADGYNAKKISTQAIDKLIASVSDYSQSYAWCYHEQGHVFYCLQIRGLETTLVYDGSTGQWHERSYYNAGLREPHLGAIQLFFDQKTLIGDRRNGNIYQMSLGIYSDNGNELVRERISPHIQEEKKVIPHSCFELDLEVGVGLASGQGSDPQIVMQYSDDGGRTWSNQLWRSIGAIGEYNTRVAWRKLGLSRNRVYKIRYSDPTQFQINGAYLNAT